MPLAVFPKKILRKTSPSRPKRPFSNTRRPSYIILSPRRIESHFLLILWDFVHLGSMFAILRAQNAECVIRESLQTGQPKTRTRENANTFDDYKSNVPSLWPERHNGEGSSLWEFCSLPRMQTGFYGRLPTRSRDSTWRRRTQHSNGRFRGGSTLSAPDGPGSIVAIARTTASPHPDYHVENIPDDSITFAPSRSICKISDPLHLRHNFLLGCTPRFRRE